MRDAMYDDERRLQDRTVNLLLLTKRFGRPDRVKKAIAKYMSEECDCNINRYTDGIIFSILKEAMFDFMQHARHRDMIAFIREFIESRYDKDVERLIIAMSMTQVKAKINGEYHEINGWHETEFTQKIDAQQWGLEEDS